MSRRSQRAESVPCFNEERLGIRQFTLVSVHHGWIVHGSERLEMIVSARSAKNAPALQ
jgi:hypothetical protein